MERLTAKTDNGYVLRLPTDKSTSDLEIKFNVYDKLGKYEDAEEQGLLLKLPCRVGDTVYEISRVEPYRNPAIREMGVVDILLREDDMYFALQDLYDEDYDNSILSTEFGYTVFFTMEQAGQALKQMGE